MVHGNKSPREPWDDPDGAMFIANELRDCRFVGLHICWPVVGPQVGTETTHVITAWGDEGNSGQWQNNPAQLKVTDSDRDTPGDVQTYDYDDFDDPQHQSAEGPGWYFDWSEPIHPYIMNITVLLPPPDGPVYCQGNTKAVGSYRIEQKQAEDATDLHYRVGTDTSICSYMTTIDRTSAPPEIQEDQQPPWELTVDWDLSSNPVQTGHTVTITTQFYLNVWNAIEYKDVHYTYPDPNDPNSSLPGPPGPCFGWRLDPVVIADPNDPNDYVPGMSGGYVIGAFELYDDPLGTSRAAEYRFQHEYLPHQDPEWHQFTLESLCDPNDEYYVGQMRFGHSYTLLDDQALWALDPNDPGQWLEIVPGIAPFEPNMPIQLDLIWPGMLPYPCGGNYIECAGDLDCDGQVDFGDINPFVQILIQPTLWQADHPTCPLLNGDLNEDGAVSFGDINPFVDLLTGGSLPILCQ